MNGRLIKTALIALALVFSFTSVAVRLTAKHANAPDSRLREGVTPTLGDYADTSVSQSGNTMITPSAAPANTTSINVSTDTNFKGTLVASPATGVVTVTDAHPAGIYTVAVKAFGPGGTMTKTFALTVSSPPCGANLTAGFGNAADVGVGDSPMSLAIGDFNGDGKQDLAVANFKSDTVSIRLGDGLGGFSGSTEVTAGFGPRLVKIGDFNGDGNHDLAVANFVSGTVSILLGNGLGGFSASSSVNVGGSAISLAIGDFNGDGRQDLAIVNYSAETVLIRLGNGVGGFSSSTNVSAGFSPISLAIGDFNGNGNQDLAVANWSLNRVSIRLGDGLGGFSGSTSVSVGDVPIPVAIGDFNGDGKQDLAVANSGSGTVSIPLGDGLGGFSGSTSVSVGADPGSIAIGDFNGDGNQDLAVANNGSNTVSIRLGDGLGGFSGSTNVSVGSGPRSVAIGDFNGDGRQDWAAANIDSNAVSIRLGQCVPTPTPAATPCAGCTPTPPPETPTPTPAHTPTPAPDTVHFLHQNFDTVTPPNLPGGWQTSFANGAGDCTPTGTCALGTNWITSTSNPYSGPIAVFHDAPGCVTDSNLETPVLSVPDASNLGDVIITFQHNFDLQNSRDGGVLEISYDGGCFADIESMGGAASYNGTISTGFQSPIEGRNAWTGSSGGYISGSARLPSSARGHGVRLRFRLATDCSGSGNGWSIDVIDIRAHINGSGTPAGTPTPSPMPTAHPTVCTLTEGLNDIGILPAMGWVTRNNSGQFRITDWSNGNPARFPAQSGAPNSYIAASSTTGCGTISNWFITPPLTLANSGLLTFWTRTVDSPIRPDRLQVRMSTNGTSSNVGTTPTDIGDFSTLLLDINPTYTTSGYPSVWTQYTIAISGLASPVTGRIAFRYFVENGGPNGSNSDYIGIDTISYSCGALTPTPTPETPTPTPTPTATPGTPTPTSTPTATASAETHALNLSTRLLVGFGNNVGIGGFIITGTGPRQVLLRGIGPSLSGFGVPNPLADPVLELHGAGPFATITNNNWKDSQQTAIEATGIPPGNDLESAILVTLNPGAYTAILSGNNNGTGVGLMEIYDLSQGTSSKLANISTRGFVSTDIVIAGFILGGGSNDDFIVVRGIGPSLTNFGVDNALTNPTLDLRNGEGALVVSNDDWQSVPPGPPVSLPPGLAPTNALESAIAALLPPGAYTALLSGVNGGTGVGLVEVYDLGALP